MDGAMTSDVRRDDVGRGGVLRDCVDCRKCHETTPKEERQRENAGARTPKRERRSENAKARTPENADVARVEKRISVARTVATTLVRNDARKSHGRSHNALPVHNPS